jgi:hypothetical protein
LRTNALLLFTILVGALIGIIARDRIPIVVLLMYAPILPLGAVALVWDITARGRALPKGHFTLGATGVLAIACGVFITFGASLPPAPDAPGVMPLTVLQWNVRWGGGGGGVDGTSPRWDSICRGIVRHAPDIVILSECPSRERLDQLQRTLGPTWMSAGSEHGKRARYLL